MLVSPYQKGTNVVLSGDAYRVAQFIPTLEAYLRRWGFDTHLSPEHFMIEDDRLYLINQGQISPVVDTLPTQAPSEPEPEIPASEPAPADPSEAEVTDTGSAKPVKKVGRRNAEPTQEEKPEPRRGRRSQSGEPEEAKPIEKKAAKPARVAPPPPDPEELARAAEARADAVKAEAEAYLAENGAEAFTAENLMEAGLYRRLYSNWPGGYGAMRTELGLGKRERQRPTRPEPEPQRASQEELRSPFQRAVVAASTPEDATYNDIREAVRGIRPELNDDEFNAYFRNVATSLRGKGYNIPLGERRAGSEMSPQTQAILTAGQAPGATFESVRAQFPGISVAPIAAKLRDRGHSFPYAVELPAHMQKSPQTQAILAAGQAPGATFESVRAQFPGIAPNKFSNIGSELRRAGFAFPYADRMLPQTRAILEAAQVPDVTYDQVKAVAKAANPDLTDQQFHSTATSLKRQGYYFPQGKRGGGEMSEETRGILEALANGTPRGEIAKTFGVSRAKVNDIIYRYKDKDTS